MIHGNRTADSFPPRPHLCLAGVLHHHALCVCHHRVQQRLGHLFPVAHLGQGGGGLVGRQQCSQQVQRNSLQHDNSITQPAQHSHVGDFVLGCSCCFWGLVSRLAGAAHARGSLEGHALL
jgi:hypothetical protein